MLEIQYLFKISLENCSDGTRRVPKIFAPDIVFESVAISLRKISPSSSFAMPIHSFWRFSRKCSAFFQVLAVQVELWREKVMYIIVNTVHALCKFSTRTPASWAKSRTAVSSSESVSGAKRNYVASKRKNWPVWDICKSAIKLFLLDFCSGYRPSYDLLELLPVNLCGSQTSIFNCI